MSLLGRVKRSLVLSTALLASLSACKKEEAKAPPSAPVTAPAEPLPTYEEVEAYVKQWQENLQKAKDLIAAGHVEDARTLLGLWKRGYKPITPLVIEAFTNKHGSRHFERAMKRTFEIHDQLVGEIEALIKEASKR